LLWQPVELQKTISKKISSGRTFVTERLFFPENACELEKYNFTLWCSTNEAIIAIYYDK